MPSNTNPVGSEIPVNSNQTGEQLISQPAQRSIAIDQDGDFVVTWADSNGTGYDIYARRFNASGVAQGAAVTVNTTTSGDQFSPTVAIDNSGNFVVTWQSNASGFNDIYAQRYSSTGAAVGSEFRVNSTTSGEQRASNVAMDANGDFVVTWSSQNQDTSGYGIYAQRYTAGAAQGSETQVNTYTPNNQTGSSVAMVKTGAAAGDYVIAWTSTGQIESNDVFFQCYKADGTPQGSEIRANQTTLGNQQDVSVSIAESGNFVVTWSSENQDGSGFGVYARQFDASGNPLGNEFLVNTTTSNDQRYSTVSLDKNGNFIITWSSFNQDGGGFGVYARRYSAAGIPQGSEFRVNTTTNLDQKYSTVALDEDGDAVISWMGKDTDANGIFAQVYKSSQLPSTSGIADVTQTQNAPDYQVDLFAAFDDAQTPDANLVYTVVSPAFNPGIFSTFPPTVNPTTGKLILDFDPNGFGSSLLTVRATDTDGLYVETSFNVTVTAVNDPPVVTIASGTTAYSENDPGVAIAPLLSLSDPDNNTLVSATVAITNYVSGQDALNFSNQSGITGSFDSGTGILALNGSALLVDYQVALQSVTYSNSSDNPNTTDRTIQFQVNDGALDSNASTRTVSVTAVNDAPSITTTGSTTYTEADPPVAIDNALILADPDSANITGATVSIVNYVAGEDQLAFATQNGITGSFSSGVLTLTGSATVANYAAALRSITYENTSSTPDTTDRTIRFQATDGALVSIPSDRTVKVFPINVAPVVTISGGTAAYTENATGVAIDGGLTVSDSDSPNLKGATVQISGNYVSGQDVLTFTNQLGITGNFDASTGTLTLTGTTTLANYETALKSVQYANSSDNPSTLDRTIQFQVDDGFALSTLVSHTVTVSAVNDAPVVTLMAGTAAYTENVAGIAIDNGLAIADPDSPNLTGATVRITNFVAGQDLLNFSNQNGISGSFSNGILTLTGTASLANYQAALRSVTYSNSSDNPNTTDRTIQFQVNDGSDSSNTPALTVTVAAVNDAPVITLTAGTIAYTENGAGIVIDSGLAIADLDSPNLTGATVRITNFVAGQDLLNFSSQNGISGSFSNGILTLTGTATLASYETALRSVTYANSSDSPDPTDRTIQFQVNDGSDPSTPVSRTVSVTAVNDAPNLTTSAGTVAYIEATAAIAIDTGITVSDVDNLNLNSATVRITNFVAGQDLLNFSNQNGISGSFSNGILTLTGTATLANYQTALRSVTYRNSSNNPDTTDRVLQFVVNDGGQDSNQGTRTVQVIAANDIPTVTTSSGTVSYTENAAGQLIDSGLTLSDTDGTTFAGATVTLANFVAGQDVLGFTNQNGISGSFSNGILTLTGTASITNYETALRSVTYFNSSDSPNPADRTVQFQVSDGVSSSSPASRTVTVIAVNDAPTVAPFPSLTNYTENDPPVAIDTRLVVTDIDTATLVGATVQISGNYVLGQDILSFTAQNGITSSFDATSGILTLTGTTTLANYQAALRSVTYFNNSDTPNTGDRTIEFQVNDSAAVNNLSNLGTRTIQLTATPEAPVVTTSSGSLSYTESDPATVIDSGIALSDLDSPTLAGAAVRITNFVAGQDLLGFINQNGISGSFSATTGILTLTGNATIANYQTALRSITYRNTSSSPNPAVRTVQFLVNDGGLSSNTGTRTVQVTAINSPPVVTASGGTTAYRENSPGVAIDSGILLSDPDSSNLVGATIRIGNFVAGQDLLNFTSQNGITGSFDSTSGTLSLTGTATVTNYQTALRSITYVNSSDTPTLADRTVQFQVNDGGFDSNISSRTVGVTAVNDAPVITLSAGSSTYTENTAAIALDAGLVLSDLDSTNFTSATVRISNFVPGQDILGFADQNGISGSFNATTGTLALTGSATIASYQTALRSITYRNNSNAPDTTSRAIQFQVNDGGVNSTIATRTLQITAIDNPPIITASTGVVVYAENSASVAIDSGLTLTDPDSPILRRATVRINNFVAGQDSLNFTNQNGIVGSFDNVTGVLALSGTDTPADYQTALRSVTYTNTSDNPATTDRTLEFQVNDGVLDSNLATRTLQITATNDAPVVRSSGSVIDFTPGRGAVLVDDGVFLSDSDSASLTKATVKINSYVQGQDLLSFANQSGITGSFDAATGILTLTGTAAIASYQSILRSVSYDNTSTIPDSTTRTIDFQVSDGAIDSRVATQSIQITANNNPPVLDLNGTDSGKGFTVTFIPNSAPLRIVDTDLSLTDVDSSTITSAVVAIANPLDGSAEQLSAVTAGTGIAADYNAAGRLTLIGTAPRSLYQQVLRSITYSNSAANPNPITRSIVFTVNDGDFASELVTSTVNIRSTNPVINPVPTSLITTSATDTINAPGSDDTITSTLANLQQNDTINGGDGKDTLVLSDGVGAASVDVSSTTNQLTGIIPAGTTLLNFERFDLSRFGGNATMTGSDGLDDRLFGGTGADVIGGGAGNDLLKGNAGDDVLNGGAGDDTLLGEAGNDTLDGGEGSDTLSGGAGDDLYSVDTRGDLVVEGSQAGTDTVQAAIDLSLGTNLENLVLTGGAIVGTGNILNNTLTGNDLNNTLNGGAGDDLLTGNNGDDILTGDVGNDSLTGGAGKDRLTGGDGKDSFYFTAARGGRDIVTDFSSKDDTLFVVRSGFSQKLKLGKIRRNQLQLGKAANDKGDRFIYNRGTGALYFDADGFGKTAQIQIATIANKSALAIADIVLLNS